MGDCLYGIFYAQKPGGHLKNALSIDKYFHAMYYVSNHLHTIGGVSMKENSKSKGKGKGIFILVIIGVIAIAVAIGIRKNTDGEIAGENTNDLQEDLGIPIELVKVDRGDIVEDISYIGTISSAKSTTVSPAIGGQIKNINVEEGAMVDQGDVLAKIEDNQFRASYTTAEKKLNTLSTNYNYLEEEVANFHSTNPLAKKIESASSNYEYIKDEYEKYGKLYEEGAVSKAEYDKVKQEVDTAQFQLEELKATMDDSYGKLVHEKNMAESQISEARASLEELTIKIEDTVIRAPIGGVVKKLHYNKGDLAAMGKPFANIDNNRELIVSVNITESDLNKINLEDKVVLKAGGLDDEITASVSKVIPNVNPKTRVGTVEVGPIKPKERAGLVSGNSIEVDIVTNRAEGKLIIPKSTIRNLDGEDVVYLHNDGVVEQRKISTGITVGERVEVVEGLEEGDQIANKNLLKLYQDAKVYIFKGVSQE